MSVESTRHEDSILAPAGIPPEVLAGVLPTGLSREAGERLRWIEFYRSHGHNASLTCRYFGISATTFHRWKERFDPLDPSTLESRTRRRGSGPPVPSGVGDRGRGEPRGLASVEASVIRVALGPPWKAPASVLQGNLAPLAGRKVVVEDLYRVRGPFLSEYHDRFLRTVLWPGQDGAQWLGE